MTDITPYSPITAPKKGLREPTDRPIITDSEEKNEEEEIQDIESPIKSTENENEEKEETKINTEEEESPETNKENEKSQEDDESNINSNEEETQNETDRNKEEEDGETNQKVENEEEDIQSHADTQIEEEEESSENKISEKCEEEEEIPVSEPRTPSTSARKARPTPQSARNLYSRPISPKRPRQSTDSQIDRANLVASQFLMGNEVDEKDPVIIARAIHNLNERNAVLYDGGSYEDSVRCAHAIVNAKAKHTQTIKEMAKNNSLSYVNMKQQQNQEDYERWRNMKHRMQGTLHRKSKNQVEEMKRRHAEERQKFEDEWASDTRMKYFNKASDQLKSLRKLQVTLLADRQFQDCERIKLIAQKLEKDEINGNMVAWSQAKREAFLLMEKRQKNEMDTLLKSIEVKKTAFLSLRSREERVLNNRLNALKLQEKDAKDAEKNWVRHHRYEGDVAFNEIGYERRLKVNLDKNRPEFNYLSMPTPPKSRGSGPWRPMTKM
ncbi:hypothetical protein TRFO_33639 [Tritrichomonas foetus]|uniref:Uncharacterized protein n=1 Tax=Tritrichomonas foetus TaxID=1144522 RepID=A0A1J4JL34_9EUKA|nr:hypothetical protein TRFO_33639 [Tritrichomonas foetus]|eukprot:OHS99816.1 hypothetical protein TRFO_33639 [Tritrichomonas foetus]